MRSDLFRPATDVVLPGPAAPSAGGFAPARVTVTTLAPERAAADVDALAPGHVVFSRTFFPSWKANLDGAPARVLLANGRDVAVAVPAGRHRVEFFWDPTSFRTGVALQLVALLAALAIGIAALPRRPRRAPRAPAPASA